MTRVVSSQNRFSWLTLSFAGVANHATRKRLLSTKTTSPTPWLAEKGEMMLGVGAVLTLAVHDCLICGALVGAIQGE